MHAAVCRRHEPPARGLIAALICDLAVGEAQAQAPAAAPRPTQIDRAVPKPAQIDRNGVLILVRSTLLALDHGNKTGNYTVLRDLGAPGFQNNTAARLGEIFATQRRDNVDLSGVAVIEPQLNLLPQIEITGMMRMAGFFPSVPTQVNFELTFAPVNSQWRLFGVSINLGSSAPVAPAPPPQPAPAPPEAATKAAAPKAAVRLAPAPPAPATTPKP